MRGRSLRWSLPLLIGVCAFAGYSVTRPYPGMTKEGFLGCVTRGDLGLAMELRAAADTVALQRFMFAQKRETCRPIFGGTPMTVTFAGIGVRKVRLQGSPEFRFASPDDIE